MRRIVTARRFKFIPWRENVYVNQVDEDDLLANMIFASLASKIPLLYEDIPISAIADEEKAAAIYRQMSVYRKTDSFRYYHGSQLLWWSELAI